MNMAAQAFANYLDKNELKYKIQDSRKIMVPYSGDNMTHIHNVLTFSDDTRDVQIHVWSIARMPEEKVGNACFVCSKLNSKYRWIKFYVDSDNEITAETDAIITPSTVGEVCHELIRRMVNIVDEAYPVFMKMLWS